MLIYKYNTYITIKYYPLSYLIINQTFTLTKKKADGKKAREYLISLLLYIS